MAQSLFGKFRIALLSNAHDLLDKVVDLNSVGAVRQYARDLENAITELESDIADNKGDLEVDNKRLTKLTRDRDDLDRTLNIIVTDGNDANDKLGVGLEIDIADLNVRIAAQEQIVNAQQKTYTAFMQTRDTLISKKNSMLSQISHLETLEQTARAQEEATNAIQEVNSRMAQFDGEGAPSVDSVADRLERRAAKAAAEFEQATSTMTSTHTTDLRTAQAEIALAERKRRLMGASTQTPQIVSEQHPDKLTDNG